MELLRTVFFKRNEVISYDETNGLILKDVILPEEIILNILTYLDVKTLLKCKLVCRKWDELIKSHHFWRVKLAHTKKTVKKELPWYVYYCYASNSVFDKNLLKNGNGQDKFKHWSSIENRGHGWLVEETPAGANALPENQPEFNGKTSCFATSFHVCKKRQVIQFKNNKLFRQILNEYQPAIYISEWFAGRFDCGCFYKLGIRLYDKFNSLMYEKEEYRTVEQWAGSAWEKVEICCERYGQDVCTIEFYHEGGDTQFWAGHYGSKMAGGVAKIIFDSL